MIIDIHAHALHEGFLEELCRRPRAGLSAERDGKGGYILQRKGAAVEYYDPHVASLPVPGGVLRSIEPGQSDFSAWDAVLILTAHDRCDWKRIAREARLVIDTRNVTEGIQHCGNIIRL